MKLLLTGATGFLGSHLLRMLVAHGHEVVVLKRSSSNLARIADILPGLVWFDHDRMPFTEVFRQEQGVAAIIHTATNYGRELKAYSEVLSANAVFPLQLLDAAISAGVAAFINTDTSLSGNLNPYALSKHQFSEWGRYCADKREIRFINLELEHFYGPGDDIGKFTTYVIRSCIDNVPELKLTPGEQCRDFIHVDDVLEAYRVVLDALPHLDGQYLEYGVGSGLPTKIRMFVETAHQLTGSTSRLNFGALPYREHEVMNACADVTALADLGWEPRISLIDGLARTIAEERMKGSTV